MLPYKRYRPADPISPEAFAADRAVAAAARKAVSRAGPGAVGGIAFEGLPLVRVLGAFCCLLPPALLPGGAGWHLADRGACMAYGGLAGLCPLSSLLQGPHQPSLTLLS